MTPDSPSMSSSVSSNNSPASSKLPALSPSLKGFVIGALTAAGIAQAAWFIPDSLPGQLWPGTISTFCPPAASAMAAAAAGILAAWTGWALDSWRRRSGLLIAAGAIAFAQSFLFAKQSSMGWEPVSLCLAMSAGMIIAGLLAPKGNGIERWFLDRLGRSGLQKLALARSAELLLPDQREAAVVTCRLLNEAALREQMPARDFLKLMQAFRREASRLLLEKGALLDEPESGAVRGFFGLPLASENHASEAASAGLALAEAMQQFAITHLHREYAPAECGTGITCGTLTAGLSGDAYTVAGDAVEQSRWLAGLNADYHTRILTDYTTHQLADNFEDRPLEILNPPEGAAVEVHQLLSAAGGLSREALSRRDAFRDAIMLLRAGHAGDALRRFEEAREGLIHEDIPLERFIAQAEEQAMRDGKKLPLPERTRPRPSPRKIPRL